MKTPLQLAQTFIQKVKTHGIPVDRAYLFGSHATGRAKEYSDIDICIFSLDFGKDPVDEMVALRRLSYDIDARIEPLPINTNDFNDKYSTLVSKIKTHGISI